MNVFTHSRLSLTIGLLLISWLVVIGTIQLAGKRETLILQRASIQHDAGCAYVIALNHRPVNWPVTTFVGDSPSDIKVSNLILLEDGKVIGMPHALHDAIRSNGLGDYSHWGQMLFFSASDCSNPQNNGRQYEVVIQPTLGHWVYVSLLIVSMFLSVNIFAYLLASPRWHKLFRKMIECLSNCFVPVNISQHSVLWLVAFFIFLIFVWGYQIFTWMSGSSNGTGLAIGGFFQISDSMAYWLCANNLLDVGNFGHPTVTGEWCQRRATYPTFLSGVAWIAQRNIFATLLTQALIVTAAIYIIVRRSAGYVGVIGAALCAFLLFKYATADLFMVTMTENAGLIFGCVGLALLFVASERHSLIWMAGGISIFSIALNARAGAFFVLPFLVLWAGAVAYHYQKNICWWVVSACVAVLIGLVLQSLLVLAVGGSLGSSHGNFSYVLYGLSVGGKGWQQVLIDYPELSSFSSSDALMSRAIYTFAWQNISEQPGLFIQGLQKNALLFISATTYGVDKLGAWSLLFKACWWLAWIPLFINRRNPSYLLVALCSLGVVFSAPLLLSDGGARVFAATIAVDVLQVAIGFSWLGIVLTLGIKQGLLPVPVLSAIKPLRTPSGIFSLEAGFVMFLLLLLLVPHTSLRQLQHLESAKPTRCVNDELTAITRIGRGGSMLLNFVSDDQKADFLRGQIRRGFIDKIDRSAWWRDEVLAFRGQSILLAYQHDRTDPYAPGPYPVFSDQHLTEFYGRTVRLCIDKQEKQQIFGVKYRKLNSITALD